ncbi:hypothetical protein PORY_001482 [Pneumocystis oryctolagi]|uniref:Uncharacterized protein n=1 Tax=Pneumocystis oryctolagi TaxID=42067 RepID=A0ACB7CC38_9ASCO|nr:hypothetical protein PORY_001482 [Pneumocystis oryctolagi]
MFLNHEKHIALNAVARACRLARTVFETLRDDTCANYVYTKYDCSPVTVADFGAQALINAVLKDMFPYDPVFAEEDASVLRQHTHLLQTVWHYVVQTLHDENVCLQREEAGLNNEFSMDYKETMVITADTAAVAATTDMNDDCALSKIGCINSQDVLLNVIDHGRGEENRSTAKRWWVIDPIDGTQGFLRGGQYAVCLSLIIDGHPSLGVLGCPNLHINNNSNTLDQSGVILYAVRGEGAYQQELNELNKSKKISTKFPIHMDNLQNLENARLCESFVSTHSALDIQKKIASVLNITQPSIRVDSQVKYAMLARGECDIYLRLPIDPNYREKTWDHAAGALIIEEAGGIVTDIYGKALDFTKGKTLAKNCGIVAASKHLHSKVLEGVALVLAEQ